MSAVLIEATVRSQVADFVGALFFVYTLILVAWVVASLVFSLGLRPPYNRPLRAVLDFLHDTAEPFLRLFRRLGLQIGPLDLSPIAALLVLRIAASLIVSAID
jgi:YggT family protein